MSVLENIELDTIIANTRKIAAENPDYIYTTRKTVDQPNRCDYERDGEASCLLAKAMHAAGVPIEELKVFDQRTSGDIESVLYYPNGSFDDEGDEIPARFKVDFNAQRKIDWLLYVQEKQDAGFTWFDAVSLADERYPLAA